MKIWQWEDGRGRSGYGKWPIIKPTPWFDCYFIRYPEGSCLSHHVDPAKGRRHYRLNIVLKEAKLGGKFDCEKTIINTRHIKFFRPDLYVHAVSEVYEGTRLIFSIGIGIKE